MLHEQAFEEAKSAGTNDCSYERRYAKNDQSIPKVLPDIEEHLRQLYLHLKRYNELRLRR